MMGLSWEEAVAHALTLPDAAMGSAYGKPAVKLSTNGRGFLYPGHEPHEAFAIPIDRDTIEIWKEALPETFFQTPHYVGWDTVLVRYDSPHPEQVREAIARARDYAAAKKPPRPRPKA